jgi:hypothetical protein
VPFGKTFLLRLSPSIFTTFDKGIIQEELAVYLCYRIHFDGVRLETEPNREECELEKKGLHFELTRRRFVQTAGVLSAAAAVGLPGIAGAETPTSNHPEKVNGKSQSLSLVSRTSLLDALRKHMDLTGTKKGCDHGQCGPERF